LTSHDLKTQRSVMEVDQREASGKYVKNDKLTDKRITLKIDANVVIS